MFQTASNLHADSRKCLAQSAVLRLHVLQSLLLVLHQFSHAFLAQQHQGIQFLRAEGRALGGALNFDDVARSREHHIHIAVAARIFGIIQIQQRHATHPAGRHGRHGNNPFGGKKK